jgi:hypothetical protein
MKDLGAFLVITQNFIFFCLSNNSFYLTNRNDFVTFVIVITEIGDRVSKRDPSSYFVYYDETFSPSATSK